MLGRILRSTSTTFTFGRTLNAGPLPPFGHLVATNAGGTKIYGLVYEVVVEDDPFVRQVVAASAEMPAEKIEDMRQRRQVPVEITALAVAFRQNERIIQGVPPRPPGALQPVSAGDCDETREALADFAFFRAVLNHGQAPADDLLAAALILAADCQPPGQDRAYLLNAGRELVRLLAQEPNRLDAILRRLAAHAEVNHG
jgi:hypothetical protein